MSKSGNTAFEVPEALSARRQEELLASGDGESVLRVLVDLYFHGKDYKRIVKLEKKQKLDVLEPEPRHLLLLLARARLSQTDPNHREAKLPALSRQRESLVRAVPSLRTTIDALLGEIQGTRK